MTVMTMSDAAAMAGVILICLALGAALGAAYFALLWSAVARLGRGGGTGAWLAAALARLALVLVALALAAWADLPAAGVLAGLVGLVIARQVMLRRLRPQPAED